MSMLKAVAVDLWANVESRKCSGRGLDREQSLDSPPSEQLKFWPYYRDQLRWGVPIGAAVFAVLLWLDGASATELLTASVLLGLLLMPIILLPHAWRRWHRDRRDLAAKQRATPTNRGQSGSSAADLSIGPPTRAGDRLPTDSIQLSGRMESGVATTYRRRSTLRRLGIGLMFVVGGLWFLMSPETFADSPGEVPFIRGLGVVTLALFGLLSLGVLLTIVRPPIFMVTPTSLVYGARARPLHVPWTEIENAEVFVKYGNAMLGVKLSDTATVRGPWLTRLGARSRAALTGWDMVFLLEDLTVPTGAFVAAVEQAMGDMQQDVP